MRRSASPRTTFAAPPATEPGGAERMRHSAAPRWAIAARMLLAPFALALAAIAGVLFAILLPVCGIGTIAEAIAKGGWSFARSAFSRPHAGRLRQN